MNVLRAGETLILTATGVPGAPHTKPHLWFILTDPVGKPSRIVAAKVVTRKSYSDDTVVLQPSDHRFLEHESCVDFGSANFFDQAKILKWVVAGRSRFHARMSKALLGRVQEGLLSSPFAVPAIKDYCREQWG